MHVLIMLLMNLSYKSINDYVLILIFTTATRKKHLFLLMPQIHECTMRYIMSFNKVIILYVKLQCKMQLKLSDTVRVTSVTKNVTHMTLVYDMHNKLHFYIYTESSIYISPNLIYIQITSQ